MELNEDPIHFYFSDEDKRFSSVLKAVVNDKVYTLTNREDNKCLRIEKIGDFDKDGYKDILIRVVNSCGGNCCGDSYQTYSYNGKEFISSEIVGYDWNGIEVSESSNGYDFIIETINEGANTNMCNNKVETYRFKEHKLELINTIKDTKLKAITEITAKDFEGRENEELFLTFDLDNDGEIDKITCSFWARWGRIGEWKIQFGNGKLFKDDSNPKRIGILNSKTNDVYDIVTECDDVLKWNGNNYE